MNYCMGITNFVNYGKSFRIMAASKPLDKFVEDVTECSICTDVIVDSKVLPCIHTFCLKCLEQFWKDKKPGDQVLCPLCRTPFNIPVGGLADLPKNYFVEKLLDAQKLSKAIQSNPTCDICSNLESDKDEVTLPAAKYCFDCEHKMCEQCARTHLILKSLKLHRVVKLGEHPIIDAAMNSALNHCNQHENEIIKIYCSECKTAVCQTCFIMNHNGHKCSDIGEVTAGLKDQIRKDIVKTNETLLKVNEQSGNFEKILKDFEYNIKETEVQIARRGDEIKQLVDVQVKSLLQDLEEEKARKLKEFEKAREDLHVQKVSLESFMKYSQEVLDKAIPSDIACFATGLRTRADNLKKMKTVEIGEGLKVSFFPADLKMFTDGSSARNIVGETSISGKILSEVNCEVQLRSSSYDNKPDGERYGFIRINGKEVLRVDFNGTNNKRGINTIVLDPKTCLPGVQQSFDTWAFSAKTTELVKYLDSLSAGTILLGVTFDEPFHSLKAALVPLKSLGVDVDDVGNRGMFAFALQKGFPSKTVLAKSVSRPSPLELTVQLEGNIDNVQIKRSK